MADRLLAGKRVLLGITGGIAAYKAADLCSKLVQAGAQVDVIMTEAATTFVAPLTFSALSGRAARVDMWTRARRPADPARADGRGRRSGHRRAAERQHAGQAGAGIGRQPALDLLHSLDACVPLGAGPGDGIAHVVEPDDPGPRGGAGGARRDPGRAGRGTAGVGRAGRRAHGRAARDPGRGARSCSPGEGRWPVAAWW